MFLEKAKERKNEIEKETEQAQHSFNQKLNSYRELLNKITKLCLTTPLKIYFAQVIIPSIIIPLVIILIGIIIAFIIDVILGVEQFSVFLFYQFY